VPTAVLERYPYFERKPVSLADRLRSGTDTGIIAEFKRRSPSKGVLNDTATVAKVATDYAAAGAAAISVLTDEKFFGGSSEDLMEARDAVDIPLLRKEFIIDEYQLVEAKAIGADLILLIAACLTPKEVSSLSRSAKALGLEVLLELHGEEELAHVCDEVDLVGINNRDLRTFEVDLERSIRMAERLPADKLRIAESGIHSVAQVQMFRQHGFSGFLMGEQFMKAADPGEAFRSFVSGL
jgi:indole-3-glycerol phosphate synthase